MSKEYSKPLTAEERMYLDDMDVFRAKYFELIEALRNDPWADDKHKQLAVEAAELIRKALDAGPGAAMTDDVILSLAKADVERPISDDYE